MAATPQSRRTVSVLAYPGMSVFEIGIVTEVFGLPRPELDRPWYDLTVCAERPGPVPLVGGATLHTPFGLDAFAAAETLIVPGVADVTVGPSPGLVAALRRAHGRGARLMSICSGAFALAGAGLLDGRRATTHWQYADELRRRHPAVRVDADVLYVDLGDVLTSAGSAAGLDLCVHVVRQDHGSAVANAVARRLVTAPHRDGGQAQFIEAPVSPTSRDDDGVARSMDWALGQLARPITVEMLAARARMSPRSYLRHFARATGSSPIRWLTAQRVRASLAPLETSDWPVERIAGLVGFGSPVTFRYHFGRLMRTSPAAYRRAFRAGRPARRPTDRAGRADGPAAPTASTAPTRWDLV
ncbi:helix-turn-helix domain-containing protein [Micromonospora sp. DT233]|uniref:helix-turn-helix domain-containing protein n=1 Tax=Micromonospora sp. DT233 TaxID=3393432 RepID=UPI003CEEB81A